MRLRYQLVLPLVAFCLALVIAPAFAAKPAVTAPSAPSGEVVRSAAPAPTCQLGQPDVAQYYGAINFFFPPDDAYYTLIDPAASNCPTCAFGLKVTDAHWVLFWPDPACSMPVEVSIVGAISVGEPPCYIPDPSNVICPPISYSLVGPGGSQFVQADFPIPCGCITGKAFLCINMKDFGTCGPTVPSPVIDATPDNCVTWNIYPGSGGPQDILSYGFGGNFSMWVDADCCPDQTQALPGTWGKLKTLYR
jgi:hypothetical protein